MTEYGKKKCELLEKKGFEANGFAWWIVAESEYERTYGFIRKEQDSKVRVIGISLLDDVDTMNKMYRLMKDRMAEIKEYNEEYEKKDEITSENADYDWMFSEISDWAREIKKLNWRVYLVNNGEVWDEIASVFDYIEDGDNEEWIPC